MTILTKLAIAREFYRAHRDVGARPQWNELRLIWSAYSEPHRHYHTLEHIRNTIRITRNCFPGRNSYDLSTVVLALLYHDIVYDVNSKHNEAESAEWWTMYALGRFRPEVVNKVTQLILSTQAHKVGPDSDDLDRIMNDADMSILAAEEDDYQEYARNIWREYHAVGREVYVQHRVAFLNSVDVDSLFHTDEFRTSVRAAINLDWERETLTHNPWEILVD